MDVRYQKIVEKEHFSNICCTRYILPSIIKVSKLNTLLILMTYQNSLYLLCQTTNLYIWILSIYLKQIVCKSLYNTYPFFPYCPFGSTKWTCQTLRKLPVFHKMLLLLKREEFSFQIKYIKPSLQLFTFVQIIFLCRKILKNGILLKRL